MGSFRMQSAMEYLMTYGWAILIIAVVLGALFGLGFFNSANLAPKVSPGSCQVYRPDGPGTTAFINTEGTCNNELPQYVAKFNGASYVSVPLFPSAVGTPVTISGWVYAPNDPTGAMGYFGWRSIDNIVGAGDFYVLQLQGTDQLECRFQNSAGTEYDSNPSRSLITPNAWNFITFTYNGTAITIYVNGLGSNTLTASGTFGAGSILFYIGVVSSYSSNNNPTYYLKGSLSNVQIYNTSLSANEVTALYQEGIGGDPIEINNLVGWWPLNGNANDYSGNLNNGIPTSVVYTSAWVSGYSAP